MACGNIALRKQLCNTSTFIERKLKTYKTLHSQLTENFNMLWSKYQNKKKLLYTYQGFQKCLNEKIIELNNKHQIVKCQLKEQEKKNKCLEDNNNQLEESLTKEKNNVAYLTCQSKNQKKCLKKTLAELSDTTQILNKTIDQLDKKTEEHGKLTLELDTFRDKLSQITEKHNIEELQLIKNNNVMNTELEIQKYRNTELNRAVCEQKYQFQDKTELLQKSNEQNEALKQMMVKERIQANDSIDKLRKDKLNIVNEKEELERKTDEYMEKIKCLGIENERLKTQMNESQFKLNAIIKNRDEKLKLLTEKIENIDKDKKQLNTEIISMKRINTELEEKLSETKRKHNAESEKVYNLERRLKNAGHKPIKYIQCSLTNTVSTDPIFPSRMMVLDELKSISESCLNSEDSFTESLENITNFKM